jgi:hypothetical protein
VGVAAKVGVRKNFVKRNMGNNRKTIKKDRSMGLKRELLPIFP